MDSIASMGEPWPINKAGIRVEDGVFMMGSSLCVSGSLERLPESGHFFLKQFTIALASHNLINAGAGLCHGGIGSVGHAFGVD